MATTRREVSALDRDSRLQAAASAVQHRAAPGDRLYRLLLPAALILLYAPTIVWLFERWTLSVWHNAHGLFVPPIVGYFVYQELREHPGGPPAASAWGFPVLIAALTLHVIDLGMNTQLLSAISIVIALPGLSLLLLGVERTKAILFPLLFLAFMLPIPLALTEPIHLMLRQLAADAAAVVLPRIGIPTYVEETMLLLPNANLLVADACSGFSTLYAAITLACLLAAAAANWSVRLLLIVVAAPLAIVANILRVVLLAILTYWQGDDVLATSLHGASGILTFALVLPALFWIANAAEKAAEKKA